jgi:fumarate hydratase subunit beta
MKKLQLPLKKEEILALKAGEQVLVSGVVYTARDAAHARMVEEMEQGKNPPFDLTDACIFYTGPCPARPGQVIGSCGPTTSKRMDSYAPYLYSRGVRCVLGKGPVGAEVRQSIQKNGCVYFTLTGGAGALLAGCVKEAELVAYPELGTEAVRRLLVEDMPAIVAVDANGGDIFNLKIEN